MSRVKAVQQTDLSPEDQEFYKFPSLAKTKRMCCFK